MVLRVREAPEAAETQAAIIDLEGHFYTDPPYIKVLSVRDRREIDGNRLFSEPFAGGAQEIRRPRLPVSRFKTS